MKTRRDSLRFLESFLRRPVQVGAVLPSSRYLAEALAGGLPLERGDLVVEYGPGTGPVTQVIRRQLGEGMRYLGIEKDEQFHRILEHRFPELEFVNDGVERVVKILAEHGLGRAKVIVSGLPFAGLPEPLRNRIIAATRRVLRPDGEFRTFQYVHAYSLPRARMFRRNMRKVFPHFERSKPILRNVPPAYVLRYRP